MNPEIIEKPGRIENKILLYFKMVAGGCSDYIDNCDYTPYRCGYSEASERPVNTYELCLFVADIIQCPGEIEKHYRDDHTDSTFKNVLRAIKNLERKGYIEKNKGNESLGNLTSIWFMTYKLADPCLYGKNKPGRINSFQQAMHMKS
jgi:hypothetical protein